MVIIHTKTLEKKGIDDVTPRESCLELCGPPIMSQGTALFSRGGLAALTPSLPVTEVGVWPDVGRHCAIQQSPVGSSLESLWDALPEAGTAGALTSLIRDLSLGEGAASLQPPSKRQCRSLSCSDEHGGGRATWRPQGSRVWMTVEKRRCHSGGSMQRCSGGPPVGGSPAMQRSSSFSLPARSNSPPQGSEPAYFSFASLFPSPCPVPPRPLYLSQEQICPPQGTRGASSASSPDSTPEMGRRTSPRGLSRSRSQPCVLNDRKIGMKRRRPEDVQEPRPSLDLAKMTQKLHSFHSLSCPGFTEVDRHLLSPSPSCCKGTERMSAFAAAATPTSALGAEPQHSNQDDSSSEDVDSDSTGSEELRVGVAPRWDACGSGIGRDASQLGGELDIEQIERN